MTDREQDLLEALIALEDACDEVAGARTEEVYQTMMRAGMEDVLYTLGEARRRAVDLVKGTEAFRAIQEKRHARVRALIEGRSDSTP